MAGGQVTLWTADQRRGQTGRHLAVQEDWFDVSINLRSRTGWRKKDDGTTIIAEQFAGVSAGDPYPPARDGLAGIWKPCELEGAGLAGSPDRPRMIAVQAAGCAPLSKPFEHARQNL
jgi:threonine synthase